MITTEWFPKLCSIGFSNFSLFPLQVHALYKKVDKTSLAKTARDVIRITLTPSLYNSFNFKGKGDRNKNAWAELNMYNLVQKCECFVVANFENSILAYTCFALLIYLCSNTSKQNEEQCSKVLGSMKEIPLSIPLLPLIGSNTG